MEWYGPLTILPAIALVILSTSNFIVSSNSEIQALEKETDRNLAIIRLKLAQLRRLSVAISFLYSSILLFLFASLSTLLVSSKLAFNSLMILAVLLTTCAVVILLIHAIRAVEIRLKHLRI